MIVEKDFIVKTRYSTVEDAREAIRQLKSPELLKANYRSDILGSINQSGSFILTGSNKITSSQEYVGYIVLENETIYFKGDVRIKKSQTAIGFTLLTAGLFLGPISLFVPNLGLVGCVICILLSSSYLLSRYFSKAFRKDIIRFANSNK